MSDEQKPPNGAPEDAIMLPPICEKHEALLVAGAGYGPHDDWKLLLIVSQIVLFQMATCDPRTHLKTQGDIKKIASLGCFACQYPDKFGELVEVAKGKDLKKLKELGDAHIERARRDNKT